MANRRQYFANPFQLYHLSYENLGGKTLKPRPLEKWRAMEGENWRSSRICVSTSIDGALSSLLDSDLNPFGKEFWVHVPVSLEELFLKGNVYKPSLKQVPDSEATGEHWLKAATTFKCIGKIEVLDIDEEKDLYYAWDGENICINSFKWKWIIMKI